MQRWQPRTIAFCDFSTPLSKVLRLPRKIDARSYEVLHLSRKIILANLQIWCSKMQPLSGNQRPDLRTSLMNLSFVLRLPQKMHLCRSSSNAPRLPWFLEMRQNPHVLLTFDKVHNPLRLPRETTSEPLRHLNFQKWSDAGVFCTFWLRNVLRATTACTFSTSQLPKAVRTWGFSSFFTYKGAWRHNGVQFFISHLARWLRTRRFSEPTFDPPEPQVIGKTLCFATFLPFRASASSFFWLFLFSDLLSSTLLFSLSLPSSAFHLSILSEVWLLNFLGSYPILSAFLAWLSHLSDCTHMMKTKHTHTLSLSLFSNVNAKGHS